MRVPGAYTENTITSTTDAYITGAVTPIATDNAATLRSGGNLVVTAVNVSTITADAIGISLAGQKGAQAPTLVLLSASHWPSTT